MKIRRTKNLLYIVSTVMVLGLALLSFDIPGPAKETGNQPTQAPSVTPEHTSTPAPTKKPQDTSTPTPTNTPTPTPTPTNTPTPTPSLAEVNSVIPIQPATDETGTSLTTVITNYLNEFYSNEELQVKEVNNITCYYKEGVADISYFVYASYDILYKGSNVPIPTFKEYLISINGENVSVLTESENADVNEALLLSRASKELSELYIKELMRCFFNAKLAGDEALLSTLVTDISVLDMEDIRKKAEYIEEYQNLTYVFHSCPESVTEFDYIVSVASDSKIVNIKTAAPGLDQFMITFDNNNLPRIFFGNVTTETDEYIKTYNAGEEFQTTYNTMFSRYLEALSSDSELLKFTENLTRQ